MPCKVCSSMKYDDGDEYDICYTCRECCIKEEINKLQGLLSYSVDDNDSEE
jgi:hypothetical protein